MQGAPWSALLFKFWWKGGNQNELELETYGPQCSATALTNVTLNAGLSWRPLDWLSGWLGSARSYGTR